MVFQIVLIMRAGIRVCSFSSLPLTAGDVRQLLFGLPFTVYLRCYVVFSK